MALLTGMTEDGQEVPVQVKPDGRLVAEGLQGPPGADGSSPMSYLQRKQASGNVVEFQGIPASTKRISITFGGVSINGDTPTTIAIQLGTAIGWQERDYAGAYGYQGSPGHSIINMHVGSFQIYADNPTDYYFGTASLTKISDLNYWSLSALLSWSTRPYLLPASGAVSTGSSPATKLRLFIQNPAFVFDLGFFDVLCEG